MRGFGFRSHFVSAHTQKSLFYFEFGLVSENTLRYYLTVNKLRKKRTATLEIVCSAYSGEKAIAN